MITENNVDTFWDEVENDFNARLDDLAEQYARLLAEKAINERNWNKTAIDEVLRPNMTVYRNTIDAHFDKWEFAEF